ncbi:MAG: MarR family transcriptional regulator [Sedimentibacter sp.]|uniref:MarR family winged helix-turn-helix transcriptional regulator n=1 Tax=Sedimentibacter sp. TaxID=1960295 RepID=UPI0031584B5D
MYFDLDKCVGHITENVIKQITEAFGKRLENTEITRIQWIALYHLKSNKIMSQRDLSNLMYVKDSSAGRLIDRLERDGLIKRERNNSDRRIIYVELTEKGDQLITKLLPYGEKFNSDLVKGISEEDLIIYEKVLKKMLSNVTE